MMHIELYVTGMAYPDKALKKDLWDIIKKSRTPPVYAIDKISEGKGTINLYTTDFINYCNRS